MFSPLVSSYFTLLVIVLFLPFLITLIWFTCPPFLPRVYKSMCFPLSMPVRRSMPLFQPFSTHVFSSVFLVCLLVFLPVYLWYLAL